MSLQDLKKRQSGVLATRQLAGAMKTVSSIKFTRINNILGGYGKYSGFCSKLTENAGFDPQKTESVCDRRLFVLLSGNRGLCGGYNIDLFNYFDGIVKKEPETTLYIACGKKAAEHCKAKGVTLADSISLPDVPRFEDAAGLAEKLRCRFESGEVSEIYFVYLEHINLLRRQPQTALFLPIKEKTAADGGETLYIPDKATVRKRLYPFYLETTVYSLLLNCAAGVQAATLIAMRSAYDTANESAAVLETEINRRRQAQVTAGVLETAAETQENESKV